MFKLLFALRSNWKQRWQKLRSKRLQVTAHCSCEQVRPTRKLVLAQTAEQNSLTNPVIMEVEFFPAEGLSSRSSHKISANYTIEGEDPNLRITHRQTSDRLH